MLFAFVTYILLSFSLVQSPQVLTNDYLQGVWAEDLTESNALFALQGDSIYYFDEPFKAFHYKVLSGTQFKIAFDDFDEVVNIKIYTDSTIALLEDDGTLSITLYKR